MEPEFWKQRWQAGTTGWHKDEVHPSLPKYFPQMKLVEGDAVFVPLCGKSLDMIWLSEHGFRVTGIEISPIAVSGFFAENNITFSTTEHDWGTTYRSENITILLADFFSISSLDLPHIDGVYDRAALIALSEDLRANYVRHLADMMPDTARSLLITLDYPQHEMDGPPFSVSREDVNRLFGEQFIIEPLYSEDCLKNEPRFQQRGLSSLYEHVFLLTKNIP